MSARDEILRAAFDLTCSRGWAKVTMADLAAEAGVSRQSVYNEFGGRDGVAEALVHREVETFLSVVDAELAGADPADRAVARAADAVFALADENPLVHAVLAGDDSSLLPLLSSESVVALAAGRVAAAVPTADELSVDVIVRLVLSHVVQPGPHRPDMGEVSRRLLSGR